MQTHHDIIERIVDNKSDGTFSIVKTQDVEPILKAIKEIPDHLVQSVAKSNMKYVGTIPNIMAVAWAREWGVTLYSKEWLEFARRRLNDPEYAKLKVEY